MKLMSTEMLKEIAISACLYSIVALWSAQPQAAFVMLLFGWSGWQAVGWLGLTSAIREGSISVDDRSGENVYTVERGRHPQWTALHFLRAYSAPLRGL